MLDDLNDRLDAYSRPSEDDLIPTHIKYIHALYCIEALRNIRIDNIDLQVAWQYGQMYNVAWKDHLPLVESYFHNYKHELRMFLMHKVFGVMSKLVQGSTLFASNLYTQTPLDPNTINTIVTNITQLAEEDNLLRSFLSEHLVEVQKTDNITKHYRAFMGLEVADRALCGVFDTFALKNKDQDSDHNKHHYGVARHEILDNKSYLCVEWLKKCLLEGKNQIWFNQDNSISYYDHFGLWACVFSILYRLVIPLGMHPNRMDRMYDKYVMQHPRFQEAVQYARKYSALPLEAVIDTCLPKLNDELMQDTVLKQHFSVGVTYPDSLVERYLTTQYLCCLS